MLKTTLVGLTYTLSMVMDIIDEYRSPLSFLTSETNGQRTSWTS